VGSQKTLRRVLSATADAAIRFEELCSLLESLGFERRMKGSHHVFRRAGVEDKINLQRDGNHAKPYQVRQVRGVILKYKLGGLDE
jgi:predicted RNA binding protein YcfA (HicA-like mRNA interferase family)